jgi:diguanylate cyclase (GGDEF)-like protein
MQKLGDAPLAQLAWGKAIDLGRAAQAEAQARGRLYDVVIASLDLAASLGRVGEFTEAMALLDAVAAQSAVRGGMVWAVVSLALERGRIMSKLGRGEEAEHELAQAIASAEPMGFINGLDDLYALKSSLAEGRGELANALADLKRSHALRERIRSDRAQLRSRVLSAQYGVERARAETEAERQRSTALTTANQALEERASTLLEQAQLDALTCLANRRRLDSHLAVQHAAARERGMPLCVAMIDIDHFKQVNDRFSHSVGDEVLREMALTMKQVCRDGDLVARYGGEEFTVVFARIGLAVAAQACERLRAAVQARAWDRLAPGLAVTISLGLTDVGSDPDPLQGLRRADALLYRAKQGGRNRIVVEP